MTARFVALAGPLCGEAFPIDGPEWVVGRDPANRLSIPDRLMSRRHCAVTFVDGRYHLRDLGSSNGTFVNGIPVGERVLEHGDRIRAGDSVLMFLTSEPPALRTALASAPGAVDDRTTRVGEALRAEAHRRGVPDSAGEILAEVLAGRVTLQAHDMVGDSPAMQRVYGRIRKLAPSDCTVLISGETGTGKELAARAIHQNSHRARRPFVAINCAALTESLLESELFGHEKGAFTGARRAQEGQFELADGGTIFLDEIGELAPPLQAKLLRVLQDREFERVGGTRTITVDVRVIAATNRDLAAEVAAGRFRQDLYYRLNVVSVDDAAAARAARGHSQPGRALRREVRARSGGVELSAEALQALTAHDWPGNVRELENAIERAVVLGSSDRITAEDLPDILFEPVGDGGDRRGRGVPRRRPRDEAAADPRRDRSLGRQLCRRGAAARPQSDLPAPSAEEPADQGRRGAPLERPAALQVRMTLSPGAKLGPYEITAPVGQGGMGEVYRARDTRIDRTVALKVLGGTLSSIDHRASLEREARFVASLNHPHICALHDVSREKETPFLVMEYVAGRDARGAACAAARCRRARPSATRSRSARRSITRIATASSTAT